MGILTFTSPKTVWTTISLRPAASRSTEDQRIPSVVASRRIVRTTTSFSITRQKVERIVPATENVKCGTGQEGAVHPAGECNQNTSEFSKRIPTMVQFAISLLREHQNTTGRWTIRNRMVDNVNA